MEMTVTSVPPKVRALGTILLQVVTLDDPFAASLDYELSLWPSPAKLSHPKNGFT